MRILLVRGQMHPISPTCASSWNLIQWLIKGAYIAAQVSSSVAYYIDESVLCWSVCVVQSSLNCNTNAFVSDSERCSRIIFSAWECPNQCY